MTDDQADRIALPQGGVEQLLGDRPRLGVLRAHHPERPRPEQRRNSRPGSPTRRHSFCARA
jgi:hypothetical protein